jgi:choice-of-anchor A domain-containing protein
MNRRRELYHGNSQTANALHHSSRAVVCDTSGSALSQYGLVTLADLVSLSSAQEKVAVGGNFLSTGAVTVASSCSTCSSSDAAAVTLQIAGELVSGVPIRVERGSVIVGRDQSVVNTTKWEYRVSGRRFRLMDHRGAAAITASSDFQSMHMSEQLKEYSSALSMLPGQNPVVVVGDDQVSLEVTTVDPSGIAVFAVDASLFGPETRTIGINNDMGARMIIVNVAGSSDYELSAQLQGTWLDSDVGKSQTLWNLHQATTVTLATVFKGSLLAPGANVSTSADIQGAVVVKSFSGVSVKTPLLDESFCLDADLPTSDV